MNNLDVTALTPGQKAALSRRLRRILAGIGERITNEIRNPNCGGCGVIAAAVADKVAAMGVPVEVVTPRWWKARPAPVAVVRKLQDKGMNNHAADMAGLDRAHLAVRIRVGRRAFIWDSDGIYPSNAFGRSHRYECRYRFGRGLPVEAAKALAADPSGWNRAFNRRQIPKIHKIVQEAFLH